jgi:uncharacterized protein (TIRG00374 family)
VSFCIRWLEQALLTSPKYKVTWKTFLLPIIGLAAFFIYIYVFNVDIQEIISNMQHIHAGFYTMAAIAALLDVFFFAVAWHFLLKFLSVRISLFREFLYVWVGIFVDTIIPAESVSGEITKIYLVNREQNGAAGKATASVVAQRLIGMSINIVTLVIGAVLLLFENLLYGMVLALVLFLIVTIFLFLVLILLLCRKEKWTMRIIDSLIRFAERITRGHWKLVNLREEAIDATKAFHEAIRDYGHAPKTVFLASIACAMSWLFSLAVFYLTFLSIGYPQISWSAILVISSVFVAVKSIPVGIPFEIGLPEITLTTLFVFFGVPWQISATATILMRLLTLWVRFFIGFGAQQWLGIRAMTANSNGQAASVETKKV